MITEVDMSVIECELQHNVQIKGECMNCNKPATHYFEEVDERYCCDHA